MLRANPDHDLPREPIRERKAVATRWKAAFAFVFVTVLLDMLAIGVIIPVLPRLVLNFLGGDTVRAADMLGLFGTVWALMQFVFSRAHFRIALAASP
jgi:MFS transporter, DHA1 family, tetracycline resistance protein